MTVTAAEIARLLQTAERSVLRASLILDVVDEYASASDASASPVRPTGALSFSLAPLGAGATNLGTPIPLATIANPSGYRLWFGQRQDGGPSLDPGNYELRIESDLYAPFSAQVRVPTSDTAIGCALQPGYAYPFGGGGLAAANAAPTLVRGTLQRITGAGQAAATVVLTAGAYGGQYVTDASGQFVLVVPDPVPATVALEIAYADGTKTSLPGIAVISGTTTVIPQTVLMGRVVSAVRGATVQLSSPAVSVGVAPDGTWQMVLPPGQKPATVTVSATVPGQRKKSQSKLKITPGQLVTVPPFVFNP
jgi:hypothetical protein